MEDVEIVCGNLFSAFRISEQGLNLGWQVGKIALDLDEVLVRAFSLEEVVMMLDELEFVGDYDGFAGLTVFQ